MSRTTPFSAEFGAVVEADPGESLDDLALSTVADLMAKEGFVLFRGFAPQLDDFKRFSERLSGDFSDYRGGGLRFGPLDREQVGGDATVLTVTGSNRGFEIPLHGEMYYMPAPPKTIWFYCVNPADEGGETTVASARALAARLNAPTRAFFENNRIQYRRTLTGKDWRSTFGTDDIAAAQRFCEQQGFAWSYADAQDVLQVCFETDAFRSDARGGDLFINNIQFVQVGENAFLSGWTRTELGMELDEWPFVVRTADGAPIPADVLADLEQCSDDVAHRIRWQPGDIALIDNRQVLHGRRHFDDRERKILVRLANECVVA